ncbi:hypothetical protein C1645_743497 [Glomus cerebriforme]|uniref:Uncharacterized protein n=1 Tax=Glomus cerebriforme TaxID=658196 RepID=A0A397SD73_9GLOM|nr:hypothetical protein C1645_743497 [Glomus cerebriforme]
MVLLINLQEEFSIVVGGPDENGCYQITKGEKLNDYFQVLYSRKIIETLDNLEIKKFKFLVVLVTSSFSEKPSFCFSFRVVDNKIEKEMKNYLKKEEKKFESKRKCKIDSFILQYLTPIMICTATKLDEKVKTGVAACLTKKSHLFWKKGKTTSEKKFYGQNEQNKPDILITLIDKNSKVKKDNKIALEITQADTSPPGKFSFHEKLDGQMEKGDFKGARETEKILDKVDTIVFGEIRAEEELKRIDEEHKGKLDDLKISPYGIALN